MEQFSFFNEPEPPRMKVPVVPRARSYKPAPRNSAARKTEFEGFLADRDWLASHWEALHLWVLRRSLRILMCPHTAEAEGAEIWAWLNAPFTTQPPHAFSFQACVTLYDPRIDPDDFRRAVRQLYRQKGRDALPNAAVVAS